MSGHGRCCRGMCGVSLIVHRALCIMSDKRVCPWIDPPSPLPTKASYSFGTRNGFALSGVPVLRSVCMSFEPNEQRGKKSNRSLEAYESMPNGLSVYKYIFIHRIDCCLSSPWVSYSCPNTIQRPLPPVAHPYTPSLASILVRAA